MEPEETTSQPTEPTPLAPEPGHPARLEPVQPESTASPASSPAPPPVEPLVTSAAAFGAPEGVRPPEPPAEPLISPESIPVSGADPFRPLESAPASAAAAPAASERPVLTTAAGEAAPLSPTSARPAQDAAAEVAEPTVESPILAGPNWMLAFVCAWAAATALNEAWAVMAPIGFKLPLLLRNTAFVGYALLGVGLAAFAIEALRWGARKREGGSLAQVLLPAAVTLAGVIALVLSHDPGRRI